MIDEQLLIKHENNGGKLIVLIFDDHWTHIRGHLKRWYKPGMLTHIREHLKFSREARKLNLTGITNATIVSHVLNPNRWF